mmetsp:Transcript_23923/g.66401  ORF Transcript_23923/g.66401 Transcript_23923/m.66401 type:complete len:238 (+) Transcript_23923:956-1669(+)
MRHALKGRVHKEARVHRPCDVLGLVPVLGGLVLLVQKELLLVKHCRDDLHLQLRAAISGLPPQEPHRQGHHLLPCPLPLRAGGSCCRLRPLGLRWFSGNPRTLHRLLPFAFSSRSLPFCSALRHMEVEVPPVSLHPHHPKAGKPVLALALAEGGSQRGCDAVRSGVQVPGLSRCSGSSKAHCRREPHGCREALPLLLGDLPHAEHSSVQQLPGSGRQHLLASGLQLASAPISTGGTP